MNHLKLLHTSDWHLGQKFMGKSRQLEHKSFLDFLLKTIQEKEIDILLVCGDIFDTITPPNYALNLYYDFLHNLSKNTDIKQVIITAGNHDLSASLIAPKKLLSLINVSVIAKGDDIDEEIIQIKDTNNSLIGVVCAVPYLRDSVLRKSISQESYEDKNLALINGIKDHYNDTLQKAKKISTKVPIITTGHLTITGTTRSDSEREIFIGGLSTLESSIISDQFDYVALGHIHISQKISDKIYYSGSPIQLSFSEHKRKSIRFVEFKDKNLSVEKIYIPIIRDLKRIKCNLENIESQLKKIGSKELKTWVELEIKSEQKSEFINQRVLEITKDLNIEVLAIRYPHSTHKIFAEQNLALELLKPIDVFRKKLELSGVEDEELIVSFNEILNEIQL
jgi:exonuclease SbcD